MDIGNYIFIYHNEKDSLGAIQNKISLAQISSDFSFFRLNSKLGNPMELMKRTVDFIADVPNDSDVAKLIRKGYYRQVLGRIVKTDSRNICIKYIESFKK